MILSGCFRAGRRELPLDKTYIMGILNLTPDSFSDGGAYHSTEAAVKAAHEMVRDGADIIDLGGQSTRPSFERISAEEEWERIADVLMALAGKTEALISVDTFYPEVAEKALEAGADIINDVSGFSEEMWEVAAGSDCGCVVMHNEGEKADIVADVRGFFERKLAEAQRYGISTKRLCFDPGIGFGKTYEENMVLLANPEKYKPAGHALLMAASRKRSIASALEEKGAGETEASERDSATIGAHTVAQAFGADILRVHDVKRAVEAARVADAVLERRRNGYS